MFKLSSLYNYFLDNPELDEILINGSSSMVFCNTLSNEIKPSPFSNNLKMIESLQEFAISQNLRLDPLQPANGGFIEDQGLRWHSLLPPISTEGPLFSFRKHRFNNLTFNNFNISQKALNIFSKIFQTQSPLIICGKTNSGKTSLMTILLKHFAPNERIFCLEYISEIPAISKGWIKLVEKQANIEGIGGFSLTKILQEVLRLRPDRIIIGEIRGKEAEAFNSAMDTGHSGIITTLHATTPTQAIRRMESLSKSSNIEQIWEDSGLYLCFLKRSPLPQIKNIFQIKNGSWQKEY